PETEVKNKVQVKDEREAVFSVFEVRSTTAYGKNEQIPMGRGAPQGLVYRIQLAAFKNPLPPGYFKGLYPLYGKINPANGVTYYYAGMFRALEAARQALPKVRTAGFSDAFIIAMMDDIQVSMERAALLEKDWGRKPLYITDPAATGKENISITDTIPVGTLSFRAEVLRSKKPVTPEVAQKIALLSGKRGMDIIKNNQGETLYLVGNFITFESAEEYVSLLIRNGYTTAKVAAYVGTQEIPVESAKELLKKLLND
ncbi:MAG TPA: SPOR domain-containing protein, partial [Bacteroidales bacterium]|nr:SPOR domain-containing protein [Bacteroidales bacterium]